MNSGSSTAKSYRTAKLFPAEAGHNPKAVNCSKIGFGDKNMVFEDEVRRILEKYKGNVIEDSLIKVIVREYADTFNCHDVGKYYSEDNNEEMTE